MEQGTAQQDILDVYLARAWQAILSEIALQQPSVCDGRPNAFIGWYHPGYEVEASACLFALLVATAVAQQGYGTT